MDNSEAVEKKTKNHTCIFFVATIVMAMVAALFAVAYYFETLKNKSSLCPIETDGFSEEDLTVTESPQSSMNVTVEIDSFPKEKLTMPKNIHIKGFEPSLTVEQISGLEKEIGGRLPDDYKQFLLDHNGGICKPKLGLPWAGHVHTVRSFARLLPDNKYSDTRDSIRRLRELAPKKAEGYLPIAATDSECLICIAYRGINTGKVFFTAYTYKILDNHDMVPIDVTMVLLADSFTDLLDYLVEIPDPYCRIEELGKSGTADNLTQYLAEGNSIDAVGKYDQTILGRAIAYKNTDMIQACIEHGASLSGSIEIAVSNGHTHLIEMLVKAGADINERDEWGHTPLYYHGGTALPGEEGEQNRAMRDLLIKLGAVEE